MFQQFHDFKMITLAVILVSFFTACSDSKTGNDAEDLLAVIQGVWSLNSQDGDVSYVHVDDKIVGNYDFMGDEFDEGPECYLFTESKIVTIEGDEVTFEEDGVRVTARVSVNNNVLSVTQKFGNIEFTELFNKITSNVDSFKPLCDDFEF